MAISIVVELIFLPRFTGGRVEFIDRGRVDFCKPITVS
jgi:hypothetical protein